MCACVRAYLRVSFSHHPLFIFYIIPIYSYSTFAIPPSQYPKKQRTFNSKISLLKTSKLTVSDLIWPLPRPRKPTLSPARSPSKKFIATKYLFELVVTQPTLLFLSSCPSPSLLSYPFSLFLYCFFFLSSLFSLSLSPFLSHFSYLPLPPLSPSSLLSPSSSPLTHDDLIYLYPSWPHDHVAQMPY